MLQPVDQLRARGLVTALQDEGEEAGRTLEVARPMLVAGTIGKRRVQHPRHLRLLCQPACDFQAACLMLAEADAHGPEAPRGEPGVVGADMLAEGAAGLLQDLPVRLVGGHRRSEEHTSELQSLMRISYAVLCLKK